MMFEIPKKQFTNWLSTIFENVDIKEKGHCTLIPLAGNHITINGINFFFSDKEKKHYFSYNKYNDFSIEKQQDGYTQTRVSWDSLEDVNEICFNAPNKHGEINPKTNNFFYTLFVFKLL